MKLLYSKDYKKEKLEELGKRIAKLKEKGVKPKLSVVMVGNNPASQVYVGHKQKTCKELGVESELVQLDENITREEMEKEIKKLNDDKSVHGILIQFPLPDQISKRQASRWIDPRKDCDGITPTNKGIISDDHWVYAPKSCTPYGVVELLKYYDIPLVGKNVVIVGRSNIVGKPLLNLLINENAAVTIVHSRVQEDDMNAIFKNADIIVAAAGVRNIIKPEFVKKGVVIVDVGIHRLDNGKLAGDIDPEAFEGIASAVTPVPGGVGPMTITMLLENFVRLIEVGAADAWNEKEDDWTKKQGV